MDWEAYPPEAYLDTDFLVYDASSRLLMVGVVRSINGKARFLSEALAEDLNHLKTTRGFTIPFGMVVDPENILIFRFDDEIPEHPVSICTLKTPEVLVTYDPDFNHKRIYKDYLCALVEAWLRDFSFVWRRKISDPPGMKFFEEIGLAKQLESCEVRPPVEINAR